ncbi:hypothetical protein AJ85_06565 [Alkalihalobacillus alcalophilus ATCC 27647 = CGMCC 1.3604]|uniref:Uncharacterized protein n=1 Tax=Alkalihalobacillus alcalophilus ATCC 27647 = CGMCC 1.3604 TaxID=1218173 RepID=A0A094WLN7_ALKAL|nr:hypothetical protein BALCAV_0203380 [Alkalihalobacillus alcalophilus ATCC 27647 = CGMCC 1.3604]THG91190.1 hypothetical protein AJ85_06565 [Alkalihalobacillus alcalophilus ATCC 27647 = CGMCC 1.3604]
MCNILHNTRVNHQSHLHKAGLIQIKSIFYINGIPNYGFIHFITSKISVVNALSFLGTFHGCNKMIMDT